LISNIGDKNLESSNVSEDTVALVPDYKSETKPSKAYARYVLFVLLIVYVLNIVDRQIFAILAEEIKADFGITDADLGFLFGTAFAVFYGTFGIAFGRLADLWNRKSLVAIGLLFWSVMTALSGTARSFLHLALCRFGVGVGESSATPAAFSMLYDYFPPKVRTAVLAVYDSGIYIGGGLGLFLGATILEFWKNLYPDVSLAPFGLKGWQAAFMLVGLPGLIAALWAFTLKEPVRGQQDGIISKPHPHPFQEAGMVLISMLPICNFWLLMKSSNGFRAIAINITMASGIIFMALILITLTDSITQWVALGIGVYAVGSWIQFLTERDPVLFGLIFRCRTILYLAIGGAAPIFAAVAIGFWAIPFFQRYHGVSATEVGTVLGLGNIIMGFIGVLLGGFIADRLRAHTSRGKLYVMAVSVGIFICTSFTFLNMDSLFFAYAIALAGVLFSAMGLPVSASVMNDLMLPRGRATVSSLFLMTKTVIGTALGPYVIGHVSDIFSASGTSGGEALRQAMLWSLLMSVGGLLLIIQAIRHIDADEKSLLSRARELGEDV